MLGEVQLDWFLNNLSDKSTQWKIIGNQVIFSYLNYGRPDFNINLDSWDGYPVERQKIADHIIKNKINDVVFLVVKIKDCYPFKSPEVTFNGTDIITYYGQLSQVLSSNLDFEKLTGKRCLCCCSIVCGNNWSVHNHIIDIRNEFQDIYNLRFRMAQRYWSKRIASRYLVEDIPLDDYL